MDGPILCWARVKVQRGVLAGVCGGFDGAGGGFDGPLGGFTGPLGGFIILAFC